MPKVTLQIEFQREIPFYVNKGCKPEVKESAEKQLLKYRKYATDLSRKFYDAFSYRGGAVEENPIPEGYTSQCGCFQLPQGFFVKKMTSLGKETETRMKRLQAVRERICYPRIGSFEVSVVSSTLPGGAKLVWSKLESKRWPNVDRLVNDLAQLFEDDDNALRRSELLSRMQGLFKRNATHSGEKDATQIVKLNESIQPSRVGTVYPPMNFSLRPRSIRVEDMRPPEIRRPGSSNANSSVRKLLPEKRFPSLPGSARTTLSGRGRPDRPMSAPLSRSVERPRSAPLSRDISKTQQSKSDLFSEPSEDKLVEETLQPAPPPPSTAIPVRSGGSMEETLQPAPPPPSTAIPVRSGGSMEVDRPEEKFIKSHGEDDFEEPVEHDHFEQSDEEDPFEKTPLAAERQAAIGAARFGMETPQETLPLSPPPPPPAPPAPATEPVRSETIAKVDRPEESLDKKRGNGDEYDESFEQEDEPFEPTIEKTPLAAEKQPQLTPEEATQKRVEDAIKRAEEFARQKAEEDARLKAEEELRQKAEEALAKKTAEEKAAKNAAEEKAAKKAAEDRAKEELAKKAAEEKAAKIAAEEEVAKKAAEERAKEELAKKTAKEEAAKKAAKEEAAKKAAEERAKEELAKQNAKEEVAKKPAKEEAAKKAAEKRANGKEEQTDEDFEEDFEEDDDEPEFITESAFRSPKETRRTGEETRSTHPTSVVEVEKTMQGKQSQRQTVAGQDDRRFPAEENDDTHSQDDFEIPSAAEEDDFEIPSAAEESDEIIAVRSEDDDIIELDEHIEVDKEQYDYAEDNESYSDFEYG